ncbi:MAG: class I SAM-dependent methyltransferase [Cyanobacteriota bacterium]|nr:class I SAM-dependent methyltransferase [Cyanobacteriota bacterium]
MSDSPPITDPALLEKAVLSKIHLRTRAKGEITFPCLPQFLGHYIDQIEQLFIALHTPFAPAEIENLRQMFAQNLERGFQATPHAYVTFEYQSATPPKPGYVCNFKLIGGTVAQQYENWVNQRKPPLFGAYPDAKVMAVAQQLGQPAANPILDVGAGTGRNTIPLAQLGHPVDAIELTPSFAQQIQTHATEKGLPVTVTQGNVLDPTTRMRPAHYQLAVISEVISHLRSAQELRLLLAKMCDFLRPGGLLLFNLFLPVAGYEPGPREREWGQMAFSSIFSRSELVSAVDLLPLQVLSEESVYDYEKAHQPSQAWPPTGWFENWASGRDVFPVKGQPPISLRWFLYRRL